MQLLTRIVLIFTIILGLFFSIGLVAASNNLDPYSVLGLSPLSSFEQVKVRYKELVFKHHPDSTRNTNKGEESEIKIRAINAAFDEIRNQHELSKQGRNTGGESEPFEPEEFSDPPKKPTQQTDYKWQLYLKEVFVNKERQLAENLSSDKAIEAVVLNFVTISLSSNSQARRYEYQHLRIAAQKYLKGRLSYYLSLRPSVEATEYYKSALLIAHSNDLPALSPYLLQVEKYFYDNFTEYKQLSKHILHETMFYFDQSFFGMTLIPLNRALSFFAAQSAMTTNSENGLLESYFITINDELKNARRTRSSTSISNLKKLIRQLIENLASRMPSTHAILNELNENNNFDIEIHKALSEHIKANPSANSNANLLHRPGTVQMIQLAPPQFTHENPLLNAQEFGRSERDPHLNQRANDSYRRRAEHSKNQVCNKVLTSDVE